MLTFKSKILGIVSIGLLMYIFYFVNFTSNSLKPKVDNIDNRIQEIRSHKAKKSDKKLKVNDKRLNFLEDILNNWIDKKNIE